MWSGYGGRVTPSSATNGSLVLRIKYAFAQINLDDWLPKGSWVRLGIQQTPFVDFELRATFRPLPMHPFLRGWRVTAFYDADHYVMNAERKRAIFNTTFEQQHVNVGFDYLSANDQTSVTKTDVHGTGWSIWATPKFGKGVEALLRYESFSPDDTQTTQVRNRSIVGLAYWFPHQGSVSAGILLDTDTRTFTNIASSPTQQNISVHALIAF
jgi:hypothetical protein